MGTYQSTTNSEHDRNESSGHQDVHSPLPWTNHHSEYNSGQWQQQSNNSVPMAAQHPRLLLRSFPLSKGFLNHKPLNMTEEFENDMPRNNGYSSLQNTAAKSHKRRKPTKTGVGMYAPKDKPSATPLPRCPLTLSSHRSASAWNADNDRMAAMFLHGAAGLSRVSSPVAGTQDGIVGETVKSQLRSFSDHRLQNSDPKEKHPKTFEQTADIKDTGVQCDMMNDVVLKFNRSTIQGTIDSSHLDDILRFFATVASPVDEDRKPNRRHAVRHSDNGSTLEMMSEKSGRSYTSSMFHTNSKIMRNSISQYLENRLGNAMQQDIRPPPGLLGDQDILLHSRSMKEEHKRALHSPMESSSLFPEYGSQLQQSANLHSSMNSSTERDSIFLQKADLNLESSRQAKLEETQAEPPVDYLNTLSADVLPTRETAHSFENKPEHVLSFLRRQLGRDAVEPLQQEGWKHFNSAFSSKEQQAGEMAVTTASNPEIPINDSKWNQRVSIGYGLGRRMPWQHSSEVTKSSNIVIPQPRGTSQLSTMSNSESDNISSFGDSDVVDIRL